MDSANLASLLEIVTSAVLYFVAKKRQWDVRESLRRSARRLTGSIKSPRTPRTPGEPRTPGAPDSNRAKRREDVTQIYPQGSRSKHVDDKECAPRDDRTRQAREADIEKGIDLTKEVKLEDSPPETGQTGKKKVLSFGRKH